jgi:CheY-like chemotaxis protein
MRNLQGSVQNSKIVVPFRTQSCLRPQHFSLKGDLQVNSAQAQTHSILNVGADLSLVHTRAQLLQSAGYSVASARSVEEAIRLFRAGDFDLVVLCHSLTSRETRAINDFIREQGSFTPLLIVASTTGVDNLDGWANSSVSSEPAEFLESVRAAFSADKIRWNSRPQAS